MLVSPVSGWNKFIYFFTEFDYFSTGVVRFVGIDHILYTPKIRRLGHVRVRAPKNDTPGPCVWNVSPSVWLRAAARCVWRLFRGDTHAAPPGARRLFHRFGRRRRRRLIRQPAHTTRLNPDLRPPPTAHCRRYHYLSVINLLSAPDTLSLSLAGVR